MIRLRFAPSPTGLLHVGNFRSALINWLFARRQQGTYILRFDDTDIQRSTSAFAEKILDNLQWAGIQPDEIYYQSKRHEIYQQAIHQLKNQGRLYPCYETAEELEEKRQLQLSKGKAPIYDRSALQLTQAQKQQYEQEGRKPHWRFLLENKAVEWNDLIRGPVLFEVNHFSDPVIIREDHTPLYSFASVVDDIDLKITHIIRGEDHVSNTAIQLQMLEALGKTDLTFAHFPWLQDEKGQGFSKRLGSLSLQTLADEGMDPLTLIIMIARLGTSDPIDSSLRYPDLINSFDFEKFGRAAVKLNIEEMWNFNRKVLQSFSFEEVAPRLKELKLSFITEDFWQAVRSNIMLLKDVEEWWTICCTTVKPVIIDAVLTKLAAAEFPLNFDNPQWWTTWINTLKDTGKKGKELFLPLRLALTGKEHGPELKELIPLLGIERTVKRLQGEAA